MRFTDAQPQAAHSTVPSTKGASKVQEGGVEGVHGGNGGEDGEGGREEEGKEVERKGVR